MRIKSAVVLITSTIKVPIYGKLADLYGHQPLFLVGTSLLLYSLPKPRAFFVATASTQFTRTTGGTVGVAVMGSILNAQMALRFVPVFARYPSVVTRLPKNMAPSNVLLTPDVRGTLPLDFLHQLQAALAQSLFWVFALVLVLAVIGLATMFLLPGGRGEQYSYKSQRADGVEQGATAVEPEIKVIG
jgi:MFS family permease